MFNVYRGEGVKGYSEQLRTLEFNNAISLASQQILSPLPNPKEIQFQNALHYVDDNGNMEIVDHSRKSPKEKKEFDSAVQYFQLPKGSLEIVQKATERCSLVRDTYQILGKANSYKKLAANVQDHSILQPYYTHGLNSNATWCVRLRDYGNETSSSLRYGKNMKSPLVRERQAILEMKEMVLQFGGKVDLKDPEIQLYILEGLLSQYEGEDEKEKECNKIFAIRLAEGPKVRE